MLAFDYYYYSKSRIKKWCTIIPKSPSSSHTHTHICVVVRVCVLLYVSSRAFEERAQKPANPFIFFALHFDLFKVLIYYLYHRVVSVGCRRCQPDTQRAIELVYTVYTHKR